MVGRLLCRARAKINLGLTVIGQRPDGYHEIESVMQQISLNDCLLFESLPGRNIVFECTDPELGGSANLVCQAAALIKERTGKVLPGVRITLYKNIPVEAGLAGGSSDAACTLLGLNEFWQLGFSCTELSEMASRLGSDVPFCLRGGTALARGRGEKLEHLPVLPFFWVVLALPRKVKISTAEAYSSFDRSLLGKPDLKPLVEAVRCSNRKNIVGWLSGGFTNTLETADLPGSDLVRSLKIMLRKNGLQPVFSGSGPTLFMMTENLSLARRIGRIVEDLGGVSYLCWTTGKSKEWFYV